MSDSRVALLEVCVDDVDSFARACSGGADRLELCANLAVGGLTPERAFVAHALAATQLRCHVMLRPRAGGFEYTASELAQMRTDLEWIRASGVHGVVLGVLRGREIALDELHELAALARPLAVTFHRAFDELANQARALDVLVASRIERVLTSGDARDAWSGRDRLRELVARAGERTIVMPGGGIRVHNARALLEHTGARELHSSTPFHLRRSS